jgi:phenylacetate-coenzyme A ligase PaaK-like adenylate-forming protein
MAMPENESLLHPWEQARSQMPQHFQRMMTWSSPQLRDYRCHRLRALLQHAKARSPFHRERLAHLDPATATEDDLAAVPVMTKRDVIEHFDRIVTDPRLTRAAVERHLAERTASPLLDRYHCVLSGGTTGLRGVFVFDPEEWTTVYLSVARWPALATRSDPPPLRMASIGALDTTHMGVRLVTTFTHPAQEMHRIPLSQPLDEIVEELNRLRAPILAGFPSVLNLLCREAAAGRLRIAPTHVLSNSEPLSPTVRAAIERTWRCPVINNYAVSEGGCLACSCPLGQGMHLSDELFVFEFVDGDGRAVGAGQAASRVYVTTLFGRTLPLIRYEIEDRVTLSAEDCPCGSAHRKVDDVQGRSGDSFTYAERRMVHFVTFDEVLLRYPGIVEYQVRQTDLGAEIKVVLDAPTDLDVVCAELAAQLVRAGLRDAEVTAVPVDRIERQATGKARRFVSRPPTRHFY